jgi:serine/threonine protein kinase
MATVYSTQDHQRGDVCALKLLLPHNARNEKTRARFTREARTMGRLNHDNIVRVRDIGQETDHFYFVMELCEGGSLANFLRRSGQRPAAEALAYMFQVLQGLAYAHSQGVVHRDVKPHNMLLTDRTVKLTDFGIARTLTADQGSRITGTGDTLGTLAYMSPEQRVDPRKAGPAADIYGVGATLYILVTGRRPFDLAMASLDPSVLQRLPTAVRPVVRRATAHRPADRYPTARSMAEAVAEAWESLMPGAPRAASLMEAFPNVDGAVLLESST